MIFKQLLHTFQVKHLWGLALACILCFIFTEHHEYVLVPLWAIQLHPTTSHHGSAKFDRSFSILPAMSRTDPWNSSPSLHIINSGTDDRMPGTVLQYKLPSFASFERRSQVSGRRKPIHVSANEIHLNVSDPVFRYVAALHNDKVVHVFATLSESKVLTITCSDKKFDIVWVRVVFPNGNDSSTFNESTNYQSSQITLDPLTITLSVLDLCQSFRSRQCGILIAGFALNFHDDIYQYYTVALDIESGNIIWYNHHFMDFENTSAQANISGDENSLPWKLQLLQGYHSKKLLHKFDWTAYRSSIEKILPISWYGNHSTEIRLLRSSPTVLDSQDHRHHHPDLVAVIHPQGLHILDLTTGHLLYQISFQWKAGSTYAILPLPSSKTGLFRSLTSPTLHIVRVTSEIISSTSLSFGLKTRTTYESYSTDSSEESDFAHTVDCQGLLTPLDLLESTESNLPNANSDQTFQDVSHAFVGLCRPHSLWEYARLGRSEWREDGLKSVPPIVSKRETSLSGLSGLWYSFVGDHADHRSKQSHHDHFDLFFLTSDGSLTSVSNHGYENWRINSEVSWLQVSRTLSVSGQSHYGQSPDPQLDVLYRNQFQPSLIKADLNPMDVSFVWRGISLASRFSSNKQTSKFSSALPVLLATGWDSVSVIDRIHGQLLASHRLPTQPVDKPILVSISMMNSSDTDLFIIPCNGMVLGFGLSQNLRLSTIIFTIICLTVSFFLLTWCCSLDAF